MAAKKSSKSKKAPAKQLKYIAVSSKNYGNALKGVKVYYEGAKPNNLRDDGTFRFGKNILEALKKKFASKFKLILTTETNTITKNGSIFEVRISSKMLASMNTETINRTRDVKNDIIQQQFSISFPTHFTDPPSAPYISNALSKILAPGISKRMSSKDKDALNKFLPEYLTSEAQTAVILKATTQVESLEELANELKKELDSTTSRSEKWWQDYIKGKILLIQQGYIKAIEKMNTSLGNTKYPDFALVTHDSYLDILEIKRPDTSTIKHDVGRDNYYWDTEMTKAIIQLENYLENISKHADAVRSHIRDKYSIDLKVVRPRGIILAGDTRDFKNQKQKDDFRILTNGIKHITIVTYDELHTRLENYISVLKEYSKKPSTRKKKSSTKTKPKRKNLNKTLVN